LIHPSFNDEFKQRSNGRLIKRGRANRKDQLHLPEHQRVFDFETSLQINKLYSQSRDVDELGAGVLL
jgi:hypothetical protein